MSPIIIIHICFGLFAVIFGYITLKDTPSPRMVTVLSIALTVIAVTGFLIKTTGSFSPLHVFSIITFVSVLLYIFSKRPFEINIRNIVGPYIGLIIAFAFTVLPSRRLGILISESAGTQYTAYALFSILLAISIIVTSMFVKKYFIHTSK